MIATAASQGRTAIESPSKLEEQSIGLDQDTAGKDAGTVTIRPADDAAFEAACLDEPWRELPTKCFLGIDPIVTGPVGPAKK